MQARSAERQPLPSNNGRGIDQVHRASPGLGSPPQDTPISINRVAITKRSCLSLPGRLPIEKWQRVGSQLAIIADSSAWWLADWLVYGQEKYPERYRKAISETTLDYQTLRNYAWVARKFTPSRRRDNLSFQHHAEVAALPNQDQDRWLDRAERFGWSKSELRKHIRVQRSHSLTPASPDQASIIVRIDLTAEQKERWETAAKRLGHDFAEWLVLVVDQAAVETLSPEQPRSA